MKIYALMILGCLMHTLGLAENEDAKIQQLNWKVVSQAKRVVIENLSGDVRVRYGGFNDEIESVAMVQHNEKEGYLEVVQEDTPEVYSLRVVRRSKKDDKSLPVRIQDKARIDLTVFVAEGKSVHVQTDQGLAEVRGLKGDLSIETQTGAVKLMKNKGNVTVNTKEGAIELNVPTQDKITQQLLNSTTGSIEVWIGENSQHVVKMQTSGKLSTDVSMEIDLDLSRLPNKLARGQYGAQGESEVRMSSQIGELALRVYPESKLQE